MKLKWMTGFTLIELMVVVALVGILGAIAYPSYQEHIRRANRSQAVSVLQENAQFMERNFTEANRYDQNAAGAALALPFARAPKEGAATFNLTLASASATTFSLAATPIAGTVSASDACGTLTLNNLGQKGVGGLDVATCWNR